MYKVGIISDTHGLLREEVLAQLRDCDVILHGGDINKPEIIEALKEIAPLYVVRGNNDKGEWAEAIPVSLTLTLQDKTFYMVHQKKDIPKALDGIDFVIYGHSHKYHYEEEAGVTYINPGSCGKRRFGLPINMAVMTMDEKGIQIEKIDLSVENN